jgi:ATP-dependent DNA helicase RecG
LRGRIGRGTASTCLLLYKAPLGETAKARLAVCAKRKTVASPRRLRLRGEGDLLGTAKQRSGFASPASTHGKYLGAARDDAALVLSRDATLGRRADKRCGICSICSAKTRRSN